MDNTQKIVRELVEEYFNVKINKNTRRREYVEARAIYYNILRENFRYSLTQIGETMNKDHATVLYAINKINDWYETDLRFRNDYNQIKSRLIKAIATNPKEFRGASTLEGFWENQYTQLATKYGYIKHRLSKYEPKITESDDFQLTKSESL